jgi:hypothetical protein
MADWTYDLDITEDDLKITIKMDTNLYASVGFGYYYPDKTERFKRALIWCNDLIKAFLQREEWTIAPFMNTMTSLMNDISILIH